MTTLTNKLNLPEAVVRAVANDDYDRGDCDITATGLLAPPYQAALRDLHADNLTEDASDRIWSLVGKIGHGILERATGPEAIVEQRYYLNLDGWKIGGKFDTFHLDNGKLSDYKFVTVWKVAKGLDPDFERQLNIYAEIFDENGIPLREAEIIAVLRDWSKREAMRDRDYPQTQVVVLPVPVWPKEQRRAFLSERIALHKAARDAIFSGQDYPHCSPEERWTRPGVFAVMKKGANRASRVFQREDDANDFIKGQKVPGDFTIIKRPDENIRCESYCPVAAQCKWWVNHPDNAAGIARSLLDG